MVGWRESRNVCVESLIGLLGYEWEGLERSQNCKAQMLSLYVSLMGGWLLLGTLFLAFHFSRLHGAEKHFFLFLLTLYIFDVYGHVELSIAPISDGIFLSMNVAII